MKRFRFSLETVLRLRRIQERRALSALARHAQAVHRIQEEVSALQEERAREIASLRDVMRGGRDVQALVDANAYLFAVSRKIDKRAQSLALVRMQESRARALYVDAAARRGAFERLREEARRDYLRAADREEQKHIDEIASTRAARQRGGVLSALGVVFAVLFLAALAGGGYLVATGRVTRENLERAVAALRGTGASVPEVPAAASVAPPPPAVSPHPAEETPFERARRLARGSEALEAAVRAQEEQRARAREEMRARRHHLALLAEELRAELAAMEREEAELAKARAALAAARTDAEQAPPPPAASTASPKFLQMVKRMKPDAIKEVLLLGDDAEAARVLSALDARLSAKVMAAIMDDPEGAGRLPRIAELLKERNEGGGR